ncbi:MULTISPECIES: sulfatase-like hydrolase/transferase [unclassified Lactobacillus]|uniref:sulfatase-like hydrolase/transferase n=1 Tax=unclassified Lactobacillus TaxID=2620435 RepID=UPI000EFCF832|nr:MULTISPECIES: sulfatase-like hydrolase/transferase [unclassified Lactobacillus]RMC25036.1 LTA synthase family protein [Lactobacillus sp. ESL0247]RMC29191.1 LTA synthase family protein [Lactobacillus sp. ESL0246]RMC32794.1 LTA synthase family protein [Lactobacillus sp. ESL0245]RMC49734.1 LTA synthase family protein [Lactobacillus sp. ESL0228]
MKKKNLINFIETRTGFFSLLVILFTIKYIFAAYHDFNLGISDPYQHIIMWLSPIATAILLFSIGFYFTKPIISYCVMIILDIANTGLLFANILYYRQFSDFITVKTITNASKVAPGLGKSAVALLQPTDLLLWLDLLIIIFLLISKKIIIEEKAYGLLTPFTITTFGIFILILNIFLAESSRPRLLRTTFDRSYIVKYLGIDTYTIYDGIKNEQTEQVNRNANTADLNKIMTFTRQNKSPANQKYFGVAKGKNVIIIHLESFQQFLIDLKVNGKEVTPFLNSIYHNQHSLSFANFYHQVGIGRTSDAETMLETGTYGISDGSLFTALGSTNTFQAAPQILRQKGNYTSAVFHGNVGTFWNRDDVYKNLGYNYFFDQNYFSHDKNDHIGYGLKDKLMFAESIKYLERMQQPFYSKFITVTNHTPFDMDSEDLDPDFKTAQTSDKSINNYFETAHYLDQAVHEFFNYLQKSGLIKNSLIVIYGDHYGLTNSENETLAPIVGESSDTWNVYNNVQMQRVPFMIYSPSLKGKIKQQVAGEIDVLPTLLHLLGISNRPYLQFGNDLLSSKYQPWVVFRNGTIVSQKYIIVGNKGIHGLVYDRKTGKQIINFTHQEEVEIKYLARQGKKSLKYSDLLNNHNLLRFYTPSGLKPVNPSDFDYLTNFQQMEDLLNSLKRKSTALISQYHKSTTALYKTNAPELKKRQEEIKKVPDSVLENQLTNKKNQTNVKKSSNNSE